MPASKKYDVIKKKKLLQSSKNTRTFVPDAFPSKRIDIVTQFTTRVQQLTDEILLSICIKTMKMIETIQ